MKSSREIRLLAWEQLRKSYWMVFVAVLIVSMVPAASSLAVVGFIIAGPLLVGQAIYLVDMIDHGTDGKKLELLFEGFKKSFLNSFLAMLLVGLFTFLWSLLFVIPGIIKMFSYAMTPYIIAENPEIDALRAIDESRAMMNGHKAELFFLRLSFIGWFILGAITVVGFVFVLPYYQTAEANFYIELRGKKKIINAEFAE